MRSLLPPNASTLEQSLDTAIKVSINGIPVPLRDTWRPDTCPDALLPWLAWALSVDEWDDDWSDDQKRQSVASSYAIHAHKGTVASIRRVLDAAGYGDAHILEGLDAERYDGAITCSGSHFYGQDDRHWAMYRVYFARPITIAQAAQVRTLLAHTAPARCHLAGLHFTRALHLYDHTIAYDGTYTHGVV